MKKLRILPAAFMTAVLLTVQILAAPDAELVRVFETDGILYTYVSLTGSDSPITKAEAKLGHQSFPASGSLETVCQAGSPVEYLLLVDNSNSMPPFREEVSAFAAALTEAGGAHTSYALATFGNQFVLEGENLDAGALTDAAASIPMDETVTRLNTSIAQALDYFEAIPWTGNQLRCLVILSDGVQYDPQGGVPYDELVERLSLSDVMLYSVGLGGDADALERMGALALASDGLHWAVSGSEEAAQAARDLVQGNGNLLVTNFDITAYRPAGGEEPVSVTFASGGELICRGAGTVRLSPAAEGDPPEAESPVLPVIQTPTDTKKPAVPASKESKPGSSGLPVAAIVGGVGGLAVLAITVLCFRCRKKPVAPPIQKSPAASAEPHRAVLPSIYLRLDVPEGIAVCGDLERELTGEFTLGNTPACNVVLGNSDVPDWQLRIALKDGAIWCSPVSGSVSVNGDTLLAERKMRSGDTVSCGAVSFRLRF